MALLLEILSGLLSPDPMQRELAADQSTDQQWDGVALVLVCRALVRAVLSERIERCREAQLHALALLNFDELEARVELFEIVERLPLEVDGHVGYLRELVEGRGEK